MFQVAIYGKGGIGKSTMSANISVSLTNMKKGVMQVGCDPKHDSTRLLLGGRIQTTVLDYIRETPIMKRKLDDILMKGTNGILCIEAGGPEPGIGCAGRGILTTFDSLRKLGADDLDVDFKIYDVLGDVVCGGFAVPLRNEYADSVILVTSGEFMSIYAANNILKGLLNFGAEKPRVAGLILNSRGLNSEYQMVERFSDATGIPIISVIPRSPLFSQAESMGKTVCELYPESDVSRSLEAIAKRICDISEGKVSMYLPRPLDDEQMSQIAMGKVVSSKNTSSDLANKTCSGCGTKNKSKISEGDRVLSCAAYGAMNAAAKIKGAAVILHGPRSCAYMMSASHNEMLIRDSILGGNAEKMIDNIISTDMDDSVSIFGGGKLLEDTIKKALQERYETIFVVTTCISGIIGDNAVDIVGRFSRENSNVRFFVISADGNIMGDYRDGFIDCMGHISEIIDCSVKPEKGYVNLVGTSFFKFRRGNNLKAMNEIFNRFGLRINCRFLDDCSLDTVKNFCHGIVDVLISEDKECLEMYGSIVKRCGQRECLILPAGVEETEEFVRSLGRILEMESTAEDFISELRERYDGEMEVYRKILTDKKAIFYRDPNYLNSNIDWSVRMVESLGMNVLKIGCGPIRRDRTPIESDYDNVTTFEYTTEQLIADINVLNPDVVIGDTVRIADVHPRWIFTMKTDIGIEAPLDYARRLSNIVRLPDEDGWKGVF